MNEVEEAVMSEQEGERAPAAKPGEDPASDEPLREEEVSEDDRLDDREPEGPR